MSWNFCLTELWFLNTYFCQQTEHSLTFCISSLLVPSKQNSRQKWRRNKTILTHYSSRTITIINFRSIISEIPASGSNFLKLFSTFDKEQFKSCEI